MKIKSQSLDIILTGNRTSTALTSNFRFDKTFIPATIIMKQSVILR